MALAVLHDDWRLCKQHQCPICYWKLNPPWGMSAAAANWNWPEVDDCGATLPSWSSSCNHRDNPLAHAVAGKTTITYNYNCTQYRSSQNELTRKVNKINDTSTITIQQQFCAVPLHRSTFQLVPAPFHRLVDCHAPAASQSCPDLPPPRSLNTRSQWRPPCRRPTAQEKIIIFMAGKHCRYLTW